MQLGIAFKPARRDSDADGSLAPMRVLARRAGPTRQDLMNRSEPAENDPAFAALIQFLKRNRGFDFSDYKPDMLQRRIEKRVRQVKAEGLADYIDYLEVNPEEFSLLFNTILINVTGFFRDPPAWEYLATEILPRIVAGKKTGEPIRVMSAGCASGEEAFTIAMLLAETVGEEAFRERVKVFGTDLDEEVLGRARLASYSPQDLEAAPASLRDKYFQRADGGFLFRPDLRRSIVFGRHDLLRDAPISRLDLLVCRNTLIYFDAEAQNRVLQRFHYALNPSGLLFLGKAEMLLTHGSLFATLHPKHRVFSKAPAATALDRAALLAGNVGEDAAAESSQLAGLQECLLESAPDALLVVEAGGNLVLANGQARSLFGLTEHDVGQPFRYLEISYRPAELRSLMQTAIREGLPQSVARVEWHPPTGEPQFLDVLVTPLRANGGPWLGASLTFRNRTSFYITQRQLEFSRQDLSNAYAELQSTTEELETTNEELRSANEELQTTNEELLRSEALNRAVLETAVAGIVVIDEAGTIQSFNPAAERIFGWKANEVIGRNVSMLMPAPYRAAHDDYLSNYLDSGKKKIIGIGRAVEGVRRDGERFPVDLAISEMRIGERRLFAGIVNDITEREQAARRLAASAAELRDVNVRLDFLLSSSPVPIYTCQSAPPYAATFVSANVTEVVGYTPRDFLAAPDFWLDRIHPDDRDRVLAGMPAVFAHGSHQVEYRFRRRDGGWRWLRDSVRVVPGPDGQARELIGYFIDITTQREAENALRESSQLLDDVLKHTDMMAVYLDPQFNFVWVNAAYAASGKHDPSFFPGKNHFDLYPHAENQAIFQRVVDTGEPFFVAAKPFEFPDQPERGVTYWDWSLIPNENSAGKIVGLVFTLAEVTERIEAEIEVQRLNEHLEHLVAERTREARASEERFRILFEQAAVGMAQIECISGRFMRVNKKYCDILGYSEGEMLQLDVMGVTHPEDRPAHLANMDRLRAGELREFTRKNRLFRQDGAVAWVNVTISPLWAPGTAPTYHIAVVEDITGLVYTEERAKILRDELAHVSRLATMNEMATGLAHEINQPLAAILYYAEGCLEAGRRDGATVEELRAPLSEIAKQADRCGQIIRRLRRLISKQESSRAAVDLRTVIEEVLLFLEHNLRASETPVFTHLPDEPLLACVEVVQIHQVLINLIKNAIESQAESAPQTRRIDVRARVTQGGQVEIGVRDCGPGIAPVEAERLFEPFFTTKSTGLGMGLKISQTIIREHGGEIAFRPGAGGGAEFVVSLPMAKDDSR